MNIQWFKFYGVIYVFCIYNSTINYNYSKQNYFITSMTCCTRFISVLLLIRMYVVCLLRLSRANRATDFDKICSGERKIVCGLFHKYWNLNVARKCGLFYRVIIQRQIVSSLGIMQTVFFLMEQINHHQYQLDTWFMGATFPSKLEHVTEEHWRINGKEG